MVIDSFRGKYFFLSNFFNAPVVYQGFKFQNNEAAFQAMKCPERAAEFCNLNPSEAKLLGRKIKLRADWEEVKYNIMYEVCLSKFAQNPELKELLLATRESELIEGNSWGDKIWGVCDGVGENNLGKILMKIRSEFLPISKP